MCSIDVKMSFEKLFALQNRYLQPKRRQNRHFSDFGSDHARAPIFQVTVQSMYK